MATDNEEFKQMQNELVKVVRLMQQEQLTPFLYGSFAINLYAGEPVIATQDIDLAFNSRREHDRAVQSLISTHGFTNIKEIKWTSGIGEESINSKLMSSNGVEFDLSYTRGDIDIDLNPKRTIVADNVNVPILSLEDLRKSYQRFYDEKPGSARKLELIEGMMKKGLSLYR